MSDNNRSSTFYIAAVYIGTVVGAGFASGQEVLQFFGHFGLYGILGLFLTTGLFIFFGYLILDIGRRRNASSHLEVIQYAGGKWVGAAIDWVITFFLLGGVVTMAAGAGAVFSEQFDLPFIMGTILLIIAAVITVILGIKGVINSISFTVPLLIASVLGLSIYTVIVNYEILLNVMTGYYNPGAAPVSSWVFAAFLYTSYNILLSVAILAPMGSISSHNTLLKGAVWGGIGLGAGALAITMAVLSTLGSSVGYEVPMVFIASSISPIIGIAYTLILLMGIYTTAVSSLFGFTARLSGNSTKHYRPIAVGSGLVAFGLAQFGFSNLVGTLYPAVGIAGLLLLGALIYVFIKDKYRPGGAVFPYPQPAMKLKGQALIKNRKKQMNKSGEMSIQTLEGKRVCSPHFTINYQEKPIIFSY
ncbi:putative membrane protein [hydrocarbon metagenome]|uniref:Putative membrane protein n=1 Tax=hydrocarbon metagenome TaxID=938273 RepID=A0A0W8E4E1_9ZZZZ